MSRCQYCGQKAGFLKKLHQHCKETYDSGWTRIINNVISAIKANGDLNPLQKSVSDIAKSSFIPPSYIKAALIAGWESAVDASLEDNLLTTEEEHSLTRFSEHFGLTQGDLDKNQAYERVAKAAILRDIASGKLSSRVTINGTLPFNIDKRDTLVWYYNSVVYFEERVHKSFVGGSHGVSIRIMRGVYYRMGSFKGHPVATSSMDLIDVGKLGITAQYIYFVGSKKSFRIPYAKLVNFVPYSDGIGLFKDAVNAKQQVFKSGDGWFLFNLVANLAKL